MSFHILSRSLLIGAACMLVMHAYATPTPNNDGRSSVSVKAVPLNGTARAEEGVPATNERRTTVSTEECSEEQIAIIELSAAAADAYAAESYDYMKHSHGEHARYVWWFGPWSQRRQAPNEEERVRTHVKNAYKAMTARSFVSGYTYDCDCEFEVIAFVDGARYNQRPRPVINLCNRFWGEHVPNSGHNSRAGTLIHEASHFHDVARSEDHDGYRDMAGTHALALYYPEVAAQSANNYRFFSENRDNLD